MFCIKCGVKTEKGEFFCRKHIQKDIEIKNVSVNLCKLCKNDDEKSITENLKLKNPLFIEKKPNNYKIKCEKKGKDFLYNVKITRKKCDNCIKLLGNYHEAIIQIRGPNKKELYNHIMKNLNANEITFVENKKEGFDIKLVKKHSAKKTVNCVKNLKVNIKESFKLVANKKGKKLYRAYYCIRK